MANRWNKSNKPGNAWNKGPPLSAHGSQNQSKPASKTQTLNADIPERFKKASENLQASVLKHIQQYESSSDEDELEEANILVSVMEKYSNTEKDENLNKTREVLEQSFQSGAAICLVCIGSVKRSHPIWSCDTCFTAFHLNCIQRWAASTIYQQSESNDPSVSEMPVRVKTQNKIEWGCPKCRKSYSQENVPDKYLCFCKKTNNPDFQPWLIPHSCGSTCDKALVPDCGHKCLLLCHPGSCPPCPKTINVQCYCKQGNPKPMRCSAAKWSCNKACNKILTCNLHKCEQKCHVGICKPCPKTSVQNCLCKKEKTSRLCEDSEWQCKNICNKPFSCGFHKCELICHKGECNACPFTGFQKCPCGTIRKEVTCPDEVNSCGGTCNKMLPCDEHFCPNKCHKGPCPPCLKLVDKKCRCGLHIKQLPCNKQYLCESKCKITKLCGRHACNKKCCDGNCSPCDKTCGKTLQCKKHKCPNTCHRGFCYPCPLTAKVTCRCSETYYSVPCGVEKKTKPPKCLKNCKIPGTCSHIKENVHKCHFGSCPPCKQRCGKVQPNCGHQCLTLCHNAVPVLLQLPKPAGPWEVQAPKIEIKTLPCPPCKVPVVLPCLGRHEESEFPCHEARITSCGRSCGRPLKCTNHTCSRECHLINSDIENACENCNKSCALPRPEDCKHPCKKGCHPAPCEQCQQFLKRQCHCGLTELYIRCYSLTNPELNTKDVLSCNQQCSRTLECGHRCSIICHIGKCPIECTKKTKVYCTCRRIKKEIPCNLAKLDTSKVLCDEICQEKLKQVLSIKEEEQRKKKQEEDEKNQKEMEEFEKKFGRKKYKKSRGSDDSDSKKQGNIWTNHKFAAISLLILTVSIFSIYLVQLS